MQNWSLQNLSLNDLTSDTLFALAIQLDFPDLLKFCLSSKKINDVICKRNNIWYYKLDKDFPNWRELKSDKMIKNPKTLKPITEMKTPRDIYVGLYWYNIFKVLKEKLKIKEDIYKIYFIERLYLSENDITVIPPEIGQLSKLQYLYLRNNDITEIPPEIGKLSNLQELYLNNNDITEIPPEIGQLSNLQGLYLSENDITVIPSEIGKLSNLRELSLSDNKIKDIETVKKMLKEKLPQLIIYT